MALAHVRLELNVGESEENMSKGSIKEFKEVTRKAKLRGWKLVKPNGSSHWKLVKDGKTITVNYKLNHMVAKRIEKEMED